MATVPYSEGVPSVAPEGAPANDYTHVNATPEAFGGPQARALQQTGSELTQASDNAAHIALMRQDRYNQIATDDAYNKYQDKLTSITYGDPNTPGDVGIYGLQGGRALEARLPVQTQIEQARVDLRNALQNDAQRLSFDRDSRRLQSFTLSAIGRHVDAQVEKYGETTAASSMNNAVRRAGQNWNSDPDFDASYTQAMQSVARRLQNSGMAGDPQTAMAWRATAVDALVISRAESMAAADPVRAATWLKTGKLPDGQSVQDAISAPERLRLQEHIDNLAAQSAGSNAARNQYSRAITGSLPIAATDLPQEGQGFLRALSMGEGNYGSPAPAGDKSGSAIHNNRYQFLYNTWNTEAPKAGVNPDDRSPAAQDRVALNYAKNTYSANTSGRDLLADVKSGGHEQQIASALNKVWPSLPGGSEQNTDADTWAARLKQYVGGGQPTVNDARGPIPGSARRAATDAILNDTSLDDKGRTHALTQLDHLFAQDDHAAHVDAEGALNEWVPKVRLNPAAVDPTAIANDARLTGEQKDHLLTQLKAEQSGRSGGDGQAFAQTFQNIYAPAGTPGRINSQADLIPLMGNGLTFSGMEKLQKVVKDRDTGDGQVKKAGLAAMEQQIVGTPGSMMPPGPMSKARYADFLGAALSMEKEYLAKGTPAAEIWSSTGPISKLVPSYVLSSADRMRNLVTPGGGAVNAPAAAPTPTATTTSASGPVSDRVVGRWYDKLGREAPAGQGFEYIGGYPKGDPKNYRAATPSAPTSGGTAASPPPLPAKSGDDDYIVGHWYDFAGKEVPAGQGSQFRGGPLLSPDRWYKPSSPGPSASR